VSVAKLRERLFSTDWLGERLDLPYETIWKLPEENVFLIRIIDKS